MILKKRLTGHILARLVILGLILAAAGCDALPFTLQPAAATASLTPEPNATATQTLPVPTDSPEGPEMLRLWLPPRFDPDSGTAAGDILRQRLDSFSGLYPDIKLEVRLKSENGPGGLLAGLSTASVSAPGALPDVVALPRVLLEAAALKGVLHPLDGLVTPLDTVDWYPYAVEMGYVQEKVFGLPFSADLMLMLSRETPLEEIPIEPTRQAEPTQAEPTQVPSPQAIDDPILPIQPSAEWLALIERSRTLAFPAADPQAIFTILLYRSAGGVLLDGEGRPFLDEIPLAQALVVYDQAAKAGILPSWLVQVDSDDQTWNAFDSNQVEMTAAWMSRYLEATRPTLPGLDDPSEGAKLIGEQIPSLSDQPYTLATGWVWAVASRQPMQRAQAEKLVEFLSDPRFLAEWNAALGYLPPRPEALDTWTIGSGKPADELRELAEELSSAASLRPSNDVLAVLGPPIRQAVLNVLNQQVEPAEAAKAAVASLNLP